MSDPTNNNICVSCNKKLKANYNMVCQNKHFNPCHKKCYDLYAKCGACSDEIIGITNDVDIFTNEKKLKTMKTTLKRNRTMNQNAIDKQEMTDKALSRGLLKESCSSFSGGYVINPDKHKEYDAFVNEYEAKLKMKKKIKLTK